MEIPQKITARPVPCDLAREVCTRIFNDYREATHFGHVELMMLAYREGMVAAFKEASEMVRGSKAPKAERAPADVYDTPRVKPSIVSNSNGYVLRGDEC